MDHTDPRSNAPIFCDRQLILERLTEWYGDEVCEDTHMEIDRAIEQFNHLVRKELADVFLEMMSGRDVLWQYIYLLIGMSLVLQEPANVSLPQPQASARRTAFKNVQRSVLSVKTVSFPVWRSVGSVLGHNCF